MIGVDIGGTKCAVLLAQTDATIVDRIAFATDKDKPWAQIVAQLFEVAQQLLTQYQARSQLVSIGITCGGPLNSEAGEILSPPNLPGWDDVPIVRLFEEKFGVPSKLENDANAGALAEWKFGAGKGVSNLIFLTFGTGLGAGMILDGKLYRGTNGLAGEVGHIRLTHDGPTGYGKQGSVEAYCSGSGLARLARIALADAEAKQTPQGILGNIPNRNQITAKQIGLAAQQGDHLARHILATSGKFLGYTLAALIDLLNPERIIIGSVYVRCEAFIAPAMQQVIENEALAPSRQVCKVVPAALGEEIGDYATVCVSILAREGKSE